jgi:hypothetical protein
VCDPEEGAPCLAASDLTSYKLDTTVTGCGGSASQIQYTGRACGGGLVRWSSVALLSAAGAPRCRQDAKGPSNPFFDDIWLGSCGVPPANYPTDLPFTICGAAGAPGTSPGPSPEPDDPPDPSPEPDPSPDPDPNPGPDPPPPPPPELRLEREALKWGEAALGNMEAVRAVEGGQVPVVPADQALLTVAVSGQGRRASQGPRCSGQRRGAR